MKKTVGMLLVVAFATASASAGIVTFDPVEDWVLPGETASFTVSVAVEELNEFDTVNMVLGSDDLQVLSLTYTQGFLDACGPYAYTPTPVYVYQSDLMGGGWLGPEPPYPSSMAVGVVEVEASDGTRAPLPLGDYTVMVDSGFDGMSVIGLVGAMEGLSGEAVVHVIPEPAAIALLGLGALGFLRRRRA